MEKKPYLHTGCQPAILEVSCIPETCGGQEYVLPFNNAPHIDHWRTTMEHENEATTVESSRVVWRSITPHRERPLFSASIATRVTAVDGGWLLKVRHFHGASSLKTVQAITFIPDPDRSWDPGVEPVSWEMLWRDKNSNFGEFIERIRVHNGWVYKSCLVNARELMSISLAYGPSASP